MPKSDSVGSIVCSYPLHHWSYISNLICVDQTSSSSNLSFISVPQDDRKIARTMPRRSTRTTAAIGRASHAKKLTKASVKSPPKQERVEDPLVDDNSTASAYPSNDPVASRSSYKSYGVADDVIADSTACITTTKDIKREKNGRSITEVSNYRRRLPIRRAATQQLTKYVEEESTTGSSSEDDDDDHDDECNGGKEAAGRSQKQTKKRSQQQHMEDPGRNKRRRVTKATASSAAPRKPLKELDGKNKRVASEKGVSVISLTTVPKRWEPNSGGDWRDHCALDY